MARRRGRGRRLARYRRRRRAIPAVVHKAMHHTPMVLTEHGVYLREQNLFLSRFRRPSPS